MKILLICAAVLLSGACLSGTWQPDPPIECPDCDSWNESQAPFRIYGNTYYVGSAGLGVILIDAGDELILLDGALPPGDPQYDPEGAGSYPAVAAVSTVTDGEVLAIGDVRLTAVATPGHTPQCGTPRGPQLRHTAQQPPVSFFDAAKTGGRAQRVHRRHRLRGICNACAKGSRTPTPAGAGRLAGESGCRRGDARMPA